MNDQIYINKSGFPVRYKPIYFEGSYRTETVTAEKGTCENCEREYFYWPDRKSDFCDRCVTEFSNL